MNEPRTFRNGPISQLSVMTANRPQLHRMGKALYEVDGNGAINQPATNLFGSPVSQEDLVEVFA